MHALKTDIQDGNKAKKWNNEQIRKKRLQLGLDTADGLKQRTQQFWISSMEKVDFTVPYSEVDLRQ